MSAGLAVWALEMAVCGWAPHPLAVVAAMVLAGPASGVACAFAQASLMGIERRAGIDRAAERATSRWALAGALGDVAAPALLVVVGSRWRVGYLVGAAVAAVLALLVLAKGREASTGDGDRGDGDSNAVSDADAANETGDEVHVYADADAHGRPHAGAAVDADADAEVPAPRFTLRELLAARRVLLAALAATACTFLDEIVLGVGALYLDDRFALAASPRSLVLGAWTVAALAGIAALTVAVERSLTPRLLLLSGGACGLALAAALCVDSPSAAAALLVVAAFFSSWHWPLCQALALRAAGERPLLAGAAAALWQPLELAAPFVVATVAGTLGTAAAMAMLLVQPAAVVVAAWGFAERRTIAGAHRE